VVELSFGGEGVFNHNGGRARLWAEADNEDNTFLPSLLTQDLNGLYTTPMGVSKPLLSTDLVDLNGLYVDPLPLSSPLVPVVSPTGNAVLDALRH